MPDLEYDEYRGGPRHQDNFLSIPESADLFQSTRKALPWTSAGDHEHEQRVVIPSVFIESLFARAPVADPAGLKDLSFMTRALSDNHFLNAAVDLLVDEGLLHREDEDGQSHLHVYESRDELMRKADTMVMELKDHPDLAVSIQSFDWLEGFTDSAANATIKWFDAVTLEDLTTKSGNLTLYVDLALAVGARATEAERVRAGSTFLSMVGGDGGGQLMQAVKTHYYARGDTSLAADFLRQRLPDFLAESAWPKVYHQHFDRWIDYTFDIPRRAAWKTATRQEWAALVQNKLKVAIEIHLPTIEMLMRDYLDDSGRLVREVEAIGDLVLTGDNANKLPLYHIETIEGCAAHAQGHARGRARSSRYGALWRH